MSDDDTPTKEADDGRAERQATRREREADRTAKQAQRSAQRERKQAERRAAAKAKKERKERVIHTRVPESLDQELKDRAGALGVSVSNLVRNVLNHTFGLVEDMISDSATVARSAKGEERPEPIVAPSTSPPAATVEPAVFGWQTCKLAVNALCERCNDILPKGADAGVAVTNIPTQRPQALCLPCLNKELGA